MFSNSPRKGQQVESLIRDLQSGFDPKRLTPLVVVKESEKLWVVMGNRRMKTLRALQQVAVQNNLPWWYVVSCTIGVESHVTGKGIGILSAHIAVGHNGQ